MLLGLLCLIVYQEICSDSAVFPNGSRNRYVSDKFLWPQAVDGIEEYGITVRRNMAVQGFL